MFEVMYRIEDGLNPFSDIEKEFNFSGDGQCALQFMAQIQHQAYWNVSNSGCCSFDLRVFALIRIVIIGYNSFLFL